MHTAHESEKRCDDGTLSYNVQDGPYDCESCATRHASAQHRSFVACAVNAWETANLALLSVQLYIVCLRKINHNILYFRGLCSLHIFIDPYETTIYCGWCTVKSTRYWKTFDMGREGLGRCDFTGRPKKARYRVSRRWQVLCALYAAVCAEGRRGEI